MWGSWASPSRFHTAKTRRRHSIRTAERRKADPQCGHRHNRGGLCIQLVKEFIGVFQIDSIESLGEPAIDGRKEITGFNIPPLVAPQPSQSGGRAQFKHPCALPSAHVQCPAKTV